MSTRLSDIDRGLLRDKRERERTEARERADAGVLPDDDIIHYLEMLLTEASNTFGVETAAVAVVMRNGQEIRTRSLHEEGAEDLLRCLCCGTPFGCDHDDDD